jgi:hypothetical protein
MKSFIAILGVGFVLSLGALAYADREVSGSSKDEPASASGKPIVPVAITGDVLRIEGENYVVKDAKGLEIKLHVGPGTKKDGEIKVGDKIQAQADASGHVISIKTVEVLGGSTPTEAPR